MTKAEKYQQAEDEILAILDGEDSFIAQMATISCVLSLTFPERFYWTGFYVVDPNKPQELVVGPYQGTLGCLRIPFGKGVCGTAAQTGEIQIVDDVHALDNHIACDAASRSEIVVPVYNANGDLIAVFDVDSTQIASFDENDAAALSSVLTKVFASRATL